MNGNTHQAPYYGRYEKGNFIQSDYHKHTFKMEIPMQQQEEFCTCFKQKYITSTEGFLKNTSLHGLKYIANKSTFDRILWTICFLASLGFSIYFIIVIYQRFADGNVIVTVDSTNDPIWNIHFPAVTICNTNRMSLTKFTEMMKKAFPNPELAEALVEVMKWGFRFMSRLPLKNVMTENDTLIYDALMGSFNLTYKSGVFYDIMMKLQPSIQESLLKCQWMGKPRNCSEMFKIVSTDIGFCYSFNYEQEKLIRNKRSKKIPLKSFDEMPQRADGAGSSTGLSVVMDSRMDDIYALSHDFGGFMVLVHHPHDFPLVLNQGIAISYGNEVLVGVTATETESNRKLLLGVNSQERKCFFADHHDHSMKYHNLYSYENCLVECKIETMMRVCNCVPYFYNVFNRTAKGCNGHQTQCLVKNMRLFNSFEIDTKNPKERKSDQTRAMDCDCLPTCESISYFTELSKATGKLKFRRLTYPEFINIPDEKLEKLVVLNVFFKEMHNVKFMRDLLNTWSDLVADYGGIVGLFLGFSFISAFEIFYFFVIHPFLQAHN